jgi:large subunit ribosomal protein L23
MNLKDVIKRPIITEKSLAETERHRYTFEVDRHATKTQIKAAVHKYLKVDAVAIRTSLITGLIKRTGRRRLPSETPTTKKAIIQIKPDQKLTFFETRS